MFVRALFFAFLTFSPWKGKSTLVQEPFDVSKDPFFFFFSQAYSLLLFKPTTKI